MSSNKQKNLLEGNVPVAEVNEEARIEKLAVPPITEMHYYFTRKPLISSRMVIAGALLNHDSIKNPKDFNKLMGLDLIHKKRAYLTVPPELTGKIKAKYSDGITILDPFAGSGMIPFEAIRLGSNVVALDYNPVAYLIMKGTIEFPLKYGGIIDKDTGESKLYSDAKKYAKQIFDSLKEKMDDFYPKHGHKNVRAYIIAWAVECPTCGKVTPLVNNWLLDSKRKISLDYNLENEGLKYSIEKGKNVKEGNARSGSATCLLCSNHIKNDFIVDDISHNEREIILAVYLDDRSFELPTDSDLEAFDNTKKYLKEHAQSLSRFIPTEALPDDMRALPARKYLPYWYKLFNPRQLLVLSIFSMKSRKIVDELSKLDRNYALAIGVYLSMILSNHVAYNSRCTYWHSGRTIIGHSLANRGINIMWSHAETNPFVKFSGSLIGNMGNVLGGLKFAIEQLNRNTLDSVEKPKIEINNASLLSWQTNRKFKFIVTDPPYYDDVPYPELMQFFQVWHYRIIGDLLSIPPVPAVSEELSVGGGRDKIVFEKRLLIAIRKIFHLLDDDGVLVMFYAHSSPEGWKYVLEALRKTGFQVTSTITLMTEGQGNVIAKGKSSVFHSLVITARKREGDRVTTIVDLEEEIRKKIESNYDYIERTYGQDRMNLMVAASGMVIETITSYKEVTSFSKNTADYALELGQRFLIEAFAKRTLDVEHIDPKTMVYIWFRFSPRECIDFSEFNQTLKALGTVEDTVLDIILRANDDRSKVSLLDFSERGSLEIDGMEPLMAQSIIDAVHITLRAYIRGGITTAKETVNSSHFGRKVILNTIDALSKIYSLKLNYREGEICKRFLKEWHQIYGGYAKTPLKP